MFVWLFIKVLLLYGWEYWLEVLGGDQESLEISGWCNTAIGVIRRLGKNRLN